MKILGIESSCDETAAAIVEDLPAGRQVEITVHSSVVTSSSKLFRKYGGIVPEVAARKQIEYMIPVLTKALIDFDKENIDALAVTVGPGLIGSLLIGIETAKTLAYLWQKPIIPVNHVLAHMYANFVISDTKHVIRNTNLNESVTSHLSRITFPAISLVVSGGHTELYLMTNERTLKWLGGTTDDAAGEAFDKTARLLGFENGGGLAIQEAAQQFKIQNSKFKIKLPRPVMHDQTLNFSFSGLKTAILREVDKFKTMKQWNTETINYFSFEVQEAITDVLVAKTLKAAKMHDARSILVSGGVAANKRLSSKLKVLSSKFDIFIPTPAFCTDNAIAIATYAFYHNHPIPWQKITAMPNLSVEI